MKMSYLLNQLDIIKQMKSLDNLTKEDRTEIIALEILELLKKHNNNEKLSFKDKLTLGLSYSEFISDSNSEEDLYIAERERQILLKKLDIDGSMLISKIEK